MCNQPWKEYLIARFLLPLKFIYSEKATKFCEIFTLFLTYVERVKVRWRFCKILWPFQNIWTLKVSQMMFHSCLKKFWISGPSNEVNKFNNNWSSSFHKEFFKFTCTVVFQFKQVRFTQEFGIAVSVNWEDNWINRWPCIQLWYWGIKPRVRPQNSWIYFLFRL